MRGDMARLELADGDLVHVTSRRGSMVLPARASAQVAPMQAFIAMHWGEEFVSQQACKRWLMPTRVLPHQQAARAQAQRGQGAEGRAAVAAGGAGVAADDAAGMLRRAPARLMSAFTFATCVPFGRERSGVLFRRRGLRKRRRRAGWPNSSRCSASLPARRTCCATPTAGAASAARCASSAKAPTRVSTPSCWPATSAREAWLQPLLQEQLPATRYGRLLLVARREAADRRGASRGRQVCSCFDVAEPRDPGDPAQLQRPARGAARATAASLALRHEVRLVRAGAEAHRAAASRRRPDDRRGTCDTHLRDGRPPRSLRSLPPEGALSTLRAAGRVLNEHLEVHQGDRPRQGRRAVADARAGP